MRHVVPRHQRVELAFRKVRELIVVVDVRALLISLADEPAAVSLRSEQPDPRAPVVRAAPDETDNSVDAGSPSFAHH